MVARLYVSPHLWLQTTKNTICQTVRFVDAMCREKRIREEESLLGRTMGHTRTVKKNVNLVLIAGMLIARKHTRTINQVGFVRSGA